MAPTIDPRRVAEIMLSWNGLKLESCSNLQTLWAGYGQICALTATVSPEHEDKQDALEHIPRGSDGTYRLVLKLISPPGGAHDISKSSDEGHLRKMLSYEVEQRFYSTIASGLPESVAVARCIASTAADHADKPHIEELRGTMATLMTDLRVDYPVMGAKRSVLREEQVLAAIKWLADFHRSSIGATAPSDLESFVLPPLAEAERIRLSNVRGDKLWLNGGYTYLATRMKEYGSSHLDDTSSPLEGMLGDPELSPAKIPFAEMAAVLLKPRGRSFESYIHGDVKSENLFTNQSGSRCAFFDFQYVGVGLGACDLAKLFTCSIPLNMLTPCEEYDIPDELPMGEGEKSILTIYHSWLTSDTSPSPAGTQPGETYQWEDFIRHWQTALVDWYRFQASWGFWGNTKWLESRVRHTVKNKEWQAWISSEVSQQVSRREEVNHFLNK